MKGMQRNITIMIWVCSILFTMVAVFAGYSINVTRLCAGAMFTVCVISTILYFLPINDRVKAITVVTMVGIGCHLASIATGGNSGTFAVSFLVLGMATLYFDPIVVVVFASIYIPISIVVYAIGPQYIIGKARYYDMGIFAITAYVVVTISLYIGTKAGNRMIQAAISDEKEAQEKGEIIDEMSQAAKKNATSLYERISFTEDTVANLSEEAAIVNRNISQLASSEVETIDILHDLNKQIDHSTGKIEENYQLINSLKENFELALSNVQDGKSFSANAGESLNDILKTIQHAREYIVQSARETEQISNIIKEIDEISSRTNLLAINASIEAARVGEKGNGFDIVAEQIRTLSVQSKNASENVKSILDVLNTALKTTEFKVNNGLAAIKQGIENLDNIVNGLDVIDFYSNQSQATLEQEVDVFESIKTGFVDMVEELKKTIETAQSNVEVIKSVADSVQSQTNRTMHVSDQLKGMNGLANEISEHFA